MQINDSKMILVGYWIRRYLSEYLPVEKNYSICTIKSYRDSFRLLVSFMVKNGHLVADEIRIDDITRDIVLEFLSSLETSRACKVQTRNQRLAAICSFAKYVSSQCPEYLMWSHNIRSIPIKRYKKNLISYLEKDEMDALLKAPDIKTEIGFRDYALLQFLYNSGARVEEACYLRIKDILFPRDLENGLCIVEIFGKGKKTRRCPLWPTTAKTLKQLTSGRPSDERVFLNRYGENITRFGIYEIVRKYAAVIALEYPEIKKKRLTPHTIRHTTATHLLQAGVDINTIRAWLGHVSLNTTNIYAEVDMTMKAKALEKCDMAVNKRKRGNWKNDKSLMRFLDSL